MTMRLSAMLGGFSFLAAAACAPSSDRAAAADAGGDAGASGGDAGTSGDEGGDAYEPPRAFLRVAHLSPDVAAIDVCLAPRGTTDFRGPLLAELAAAQNGIDAGEDAAATGLTYGTVSAYISVVEGTYDVRIVSAGAGCGGAAAMVRRLDVDGGGDGDEAGLDGGVEEGGAADAGGEMDAEGDARGATDAAPGITAILDATDLPALALATSTTLLLAGEAAPRGQGRALAVTLIGDDEVLAGGASSLRAVNAMPGAPALDFGLESGGAWVPLFVGVPFGGAGSQAGPAAGRLDANGYLPIAPLASATLGARLGGADGGAGDLTSSSGLEIDLGAIATLFAAGASDDGAHPPALLLCTDNQPAGGLLSDCRTLPRSTTVADASIDP